MKKYFFLFFILHIFILTHFACADITFIANPDVAENSLTKKEIKKIFQGRQKNWKDGSNIIVVMLKDDEMFTHFLSEYVNTTPTQIKNTWRRLIYTGKATSDQINIFTTDEAVISFIAKTKGAIGYTLLSPVPTSVKPIEVKE